MQEVKSPLKLCEITYFLLSLCDFLNIGVLKIQSGKGNEKKILSVQDILYSSTAKRKEGGEEKKNRT